jgi:hypothetical protein
MIPDRRRVIELFADHPTSQYSWEEIRERVNVNRWRLNRILKSLVNRNILVAEIQGGAYPNLVKYGLSLTGARQYATLPVLKLGGSYDIDELRRGTMNTDAACPSCQIRFGLGECILCTLRRHRGIGGLEVWVSLVVEFLEAPEEVPSNRAQLLLAWARGAEFNLPPRARTAKVRPDALAALEELEKTRKSLKPAREPSEKLVREDRDGEDSAPSKRKAKT